MNGVNRRDAIKATVTSGVLLAAARNLTAAEQENSNSSGRTIDLAKHKKFQELLNAQDIVQMSTIDGRTSDSVTVETDLPGQSNTDEKYVAFVVHDGYVRFQCQCETDHAGGDSAQCGWHTNDPHDGTVHIRAHCSGIGGYARSAVNSAYATRPSILLSLHKLAVMHKDEGHSK